MRDDRRASLIRRLVGVYPRAWRARYGEEFSTLLSETPLTIRRLVDVIAAALRERARSAVGLGTRTTTWQRMYGAYRRNLLRALGVLPNVRTDQLVDTLLIRLARKLNQEISRIHLEQARQQVGVIDIRAVG